jgi:hypothetical protein
MRTGKSITGLISNPIRRRAVRGEASIRLLYPGKQVCLVMASARHSTPNLQLCGHPPYDTALYHTIAASSHITPSCGILDGVWRYNTSLDCLIRHCAVFGVLGTCYAVPCWLTRLRPGKDGSRPYSTPSGRFLRLSAATPWLHVSCCPDTPIVEGGGPCCPLPMISALRAP